MPLGQVPSISSRKGSGMVGGVKDHEKLEECCQDLGRLMVWFSIRFLLSYIKAASCILPLVELYHYTKCLGGIIPAHQSTTSPAVDCCGTVQNPTNILCILCALSETQTKCSCRMIPQKHLSLPYRALHVRQSNGNTKIALPGPFHRSISLWGSQSLRF